MVVRLLASGLGIRYRCLVAATDLYGSGGQDAFGSLGVTDELVRGKRKTVYESCSDNVNIGLSLHYHTLGND